MTDSGYWLHANTHPTKPTSLIENNSSIMGSYMTIPPPHGWLCHWRRRNLRLMPSLRGSGVKSFLTITAYRRLQLCCLPPFCWWTPHSRDENKAAEFHQLFHGEPWEGASKTFHTLYYKRRCLTDRHSRM